MKLQVSPLVFAAALGLVGPAALEESDENPISGLWRRSPAPDPVPNIRVQGSDSVQASSGARDQAESGFLGDRIEVVTVEDRVFFDDGSGRLDGDAGTWTAVRPDLLVQHTSVAGTEIVREFLAEGDTLVVEVRVERNGVTADRWSSRYERVTDLG